jgi:hypothetical protein
MDQDIGAGMTRDEGARERVSIGDLQRLMEP